MGVVYRVRDDATGAVLGLKQLLSAGTGARRRKLEALFEREYHTLARLKHPCIIEVHDYGLTELGPFYTMELLEGGDLQQLSPIPWRDVCRHLCDVASSLALLHAHRLVHRDVTPRNIRLMTDGRAKLIDFGALCAFGPAQDVVGTPLCMAPEVLQRGSVDQRSDLFALGVVGYFALTGSHAFPVRSMEDLPVLWKRGPVPPSQVRPEIPAALDALILSMLNPDPLSRPPHAAQVIDQLCAIAGLPVSDSELAAESYLESGRLVGREPEQEWIERRLENALIGHGAEVIVSGVAGIGKTRLLREAGLDAQLRGMLVLEADAQTTSGSFGLAIALALELLERGGASAREAAQAHAGLLSQLSPELRERFDQVELEPLAPNAAEQRARFQAALLGWFSSVARGQPLFLSIDNLQAADENSAVFLATIGHAAHGMQLVLACSLRTGEAISAPQPVSVLRTRSAPLKLEPLGSDACDMLVQSLFGDVANSARVAKLLYEKSAGNPQLCMDLARLLARKQIAKYEAGTWVLPLQVSSDELPDRLEDVFAAKLAGLHPDARAVVETLCIHAKPVSIERCIVLAEGLSEARSYAALAALLAEQILLCIDGRYQFVQQALRNSLMAGLSAARSQALHRHAARVLESDTDLEVRMQRGWHLLRAGEEQAGADLLASTSRAFMQTAGAREDGQSLIAALRAALEVYERHGRSAHERAALLFPLVMLCYYCPDHRLILEYAPRAVRLGLDITGLGLAHKSRRWLGNDRALRMGLWMAERRFARERERCGLSLTLAQAIGGFSSIVPASIGSFGCHYDTPGAEEIGALAEPLALFPEHQLPSLMHAWKEGQTYLVQGLEGDTFAVMTRVLERLEQPAIRQALGDAHWRSLRAGALFMLGLTSCYRGSQKACEIADEMEGTGARLWAMVAEQVRLLHHAYRGEAERVQHYRERVERVAMQGGPTWHTELFWPAAMLNGEVLCGDTIAVRRTYQQLQRWSREVPELRVHADCARAAYLSLRGDHAQAIAAYEAILPQLPPRKSIAWLPTRGHFARALNRAGEHERARRLCLETLAQVTEADRSLRVLCFEARRQLAVADAALGNSQQAVALSGELLVEYEPDENPLLLGLLHETRAQCALAADDQPAFEKHLALAASHLRSTRNPVLIAHVSRLRQLAASVAHTELPPALFANDLAFGQNISRSRSTYSLAELTVAPDRHRYALELLIQQTRAKGGCLYLLEGTSLHLAAASAVDEPPQDLEQALLVQLRRAQSTGEALDSDTKIIESLRAARASGKPANNQVSSEENHRFLVLTTRREGVSRTIGGVILTVDLSTSVELDAQFLQAVAEAVRPLDGTNQ